MKVLRVEPQFDEFGIVLERKVSVHASGPTIHSAIGRFGFYQQQEINLAVVFCEGEWRIRRRMDVCRAKSECDEWKLSIAGASSLEILFELLGCFLYLQQKGLGLDIRWKKGLPEIANKVIRLPLKRKKI